MSNKKSNENNELRLVAPPFDSSLTEILMELNHLRRKKLGGTTPAIIFFQLKSLFHLIESLSSARIEGNNTTIDEAVESKIEKRKNTKQATPENIKEIENMENAMGFIEETIETDTPITNGFIRELHKITVSDLSINLEGDKTPGEYRRGSVKIAGSNHVPPAWGDVQPLMDELLEFINSKPGYRYSMLMIAIAHHRFCWIHPFNNGNGRTVRLLTYALLIKHGFKVKQGRLLNPSSTFCKDREKYYEHLEKADTGTDEGILEWCEYVLSGLQEAIEHIDNLTDYTFLKEKILIPAIEDSFKRKLISKLDMQILKTAVEKEVFQAKDIKGLLPNKSPQEVSRKIKSLKEQGLIVPEPDSVRQYMINIQTSFLSRGIIKCLVKEGFINIPDNKA